MKREKEDNPKPKPPPAPQLPNLPWSPDDPFHADPERKEPVTNLPDSGQLPDAGPARRERIPEQEKEEDNNNGSCGLRS